MERVLAKREQYWQMTLTHINNALEYSNTVTSKHLRERKAFTNEYRLRRAREAIAN
jgi:hypothetical protein